MGKEPGPHWGESRPLAQPARQRRSAAEPGLPPIPPSAGARVTRGAAVLALAQPLTWAATLAFVALAPHYLGARGFGTYSVATNAAAIVGAFVMLGVPTYLTRQIARAPETAEETIGGALFLALVAAGTVALLVSVVYGIAGASGHVVLLVRLALAGMVAATGAAVLCAALNGQGRHGRFAAVNALWSLSVVAAQLVTLALGGGVAGMLLAGLSVTCAVCTLMWVLAGAPRPWPRDGLRTLRSIIGGSLPFFAWDTVLRVRMQIDVVLVELLAQTAAAGHLAAAYQIVSVPVFIPTLITTPLLPALSDPRLDRRSFRDTLEYSLLAAFALTAPLSAGIAALAGYVPQIMHWPADLHNAVLAMRLLVVEPPLIAVDMVLGAAVFALHRERAWLLAMIAATIFNIVGNAALVPLTLHTLGNGAAGAAIVEDLTECIMFAAGLLLIPRELLNARIVGRAMRVTAAAGATAAVAAVLGTRSLPLAIIAGGIAYVALVLGLRAVSPTEVRTLARQAGPRFARFSLRRAPRQTHATASGRERGPRVVRPEGVIAGSALVRALALERGAAVPPPVLWKGGGG
jgi:O-antigen/teichoic acid export membrane protein